jgi:hypothetical protein
MDLNEIHDYARRLLEALGDKGRIGGRPESRRPGAEWR